MGEKADTTPSPQPNVTSEYAFKGLSPLTRCCLHSRPSLSPPFLPETRRHCLSSNQAQLPSSHWALCCLPASCTMGAPAGRSPLLVTLLLLATHHPTFKLAHKPTTLWDKVLLLESVGGTDYKFSVTAFWIALCDPKSAHNPPGTAESSELD